MPKLLDQPKRQMTVLTRKNNIEKINHLNEINKRCREEVLNRNRENSVKSPDSAGAAREGAVGARIT